MVRPVGNCQPGDFVCNPPAWVIPCGRFLFGGRMTLKILLLLSAALPLLGLALAQSQSAGFAAKSVTHTGTIHLESSIDRVFPLFGPVREKEWAPGWNPQIVFPAGKEVAEGMV